MPPPRPQAVPRHDAALIAELSPSMRAVVYGTGGHVMFVRGSDAFVVNDLEMAKVEALRALHRGEMTDGN